MALNDVPVNDLRKQGIDVFVGGVAVNPVEGHIVPGAHPGHQRNAQERGQAEDRFGLPMRIGVQRVGLQGRVVLEQAIQNIDRFPHPTGDEVAEQRDVRVTDMVVRNAPETAVPHMMLAQQIIPDQFDMGAIGNGPLPTAPQKGQLKPGVFRNDIAQGGLQFRCRNVLLVDSSQDLPTNQAIGMSRGLGGTQLTGIAKDGKDIAQNGIGEFGDQHQKGGQNAAYSRPNGAHF